jgi:hypothetical protein
MENEHPELRRRMRPIIEKIGDYPHASTSSACCVSFFLPEEYYAAFFCFAELINLPMGLSNCLIWFASQSTIVF